MERTDLTSRIIPLMSLSPANAPLTQPVTVLPDLSPTTRSQLRFQIEGNAIVTGGAGDLGFAAGRALLEHGLRGLMIWDIDHPSALAKVESLQTEFHTRRINFLRVDITNAEEVQEAVAATVEILGSVDILLTFAGVASCDHASTVPAGEWRRVFEINTTGAFLCSQAVANAMNVAGKGGSIVHVASISAHRVNYPQPQAAYNVLKAAVLAMTKSLAAEWATYGVRVNSISPGYMDTILNDGTGLEVARNIWIERNPMGRMGYPEELCGAVVLLASRAGRYITGADIVIDGGQTLF
ncbi:hypothetical protein FDECE_1287 [Fusarium decemcellulare]|nr:hypothetical protein FDECE_1287 [Fusarium decemcellulare]